VEEIMSYPVWWTPQRGSDPMRELYALRADLGRLVNWAFGGQQNSFADVDVEETEDGWVVTARLPGMAPDEVAVDVGDRELCIRARTEAEVNAEAGIQGEGSRRRSFEYRLTIPDDVDPEQVDATMDHGLLKVQLPRSTRSRRRQITIGHRGAEEIGTAGTAGATGTATETSPAPAGEARPESVDAGQGAERPS
jgi:HSP20 family protein